MALNYDSPLIDNTAGSPTLDSLKSGSDKINGALTEIKEEVNDLGSASLVDTGTAAGEVPLNSSLVPKAGGTFTGNITAPGITATDSFTSPGIDDNATSNAITIDSSENVGIGTSSPQVQLDISSNNGGIIRLSDSTSSTDVDDLIGRVEFYTNDSDTNRIGAYIQSTNQETFGRKSDLRFGVTQVNNADATEALRIEESGNVGIGTETPAEKLDVDGSIRASTGILFGTDTAAANTLDGYEEGTWTATTSGLNNMTSLSITQEEYTKIGNMVFAQFKGSFSVASGSSVRTGFAFTLPFNQLTNSNAIGGGGRVQSPSALELNPAIADNTAGTGTTGYFTFISYASGSHNFEVAIMYRGA